MASPGARFGHDTDISSHPDESIDLSNVDICDVTRLNEAFDESLQLERANLAKSTSKDSNDDESISKESKRQHKTGDIVRATYKDGLDYEAKIMTIDSERENCVIRFIGYDNEETVELSKLMNSWGKNARKKQMRAAAKDLTGTNKNPNVPFLPPMPTMLDDTVEGSENMSAMLMAWYMSGYYTGYYRGRKA